MDSIIKPITQQYADELVNFEPTETIKSAGIGKIQKSGAVALFNMLVQNGVGYLADEVGMGKTYIGLAVMSLLRYQKPNARVLIITPRRNIQEKWKVDLTSFVSQNWRRADHRVKSPQGSPVWPVHTPERLSEWVTDLCREDAKAHDTILRMSSFSLGISSKKPEASKKTLDRFKEQIPVHLHSRFDEVLSENSQKLFAQVVSDYISDSTYDLIIVDEAHNLKYGYREGEQSSNRNETLHHIFSQNSVPDTKKPWLLMLSATPMENGEPLSLVRQFECFGREQDVLYSSPGVVNDGIVLSALADTKSRSKAHELQKRLIVRRVGELRLKDDSRYTRNMYRREWRLGGVVDPLQPMNVSSVKERLINAVMQKNVFNLIQSRFSGKFRVGALGSFETYSDIESLLTESDQNGDQQDQSMPDQTLISDLCESYRTTFHEELPHPKLNAVSSMLSQHISEREKALVFVRRVATTNDLATRVTVQFDEEIFKRIESVITEKEHTILDEIHNTWIQKRSRRDFDELPYEQHNTEARETDESDEPLTKELVPSFFSWFFRGKHQNFVQFKNVLSGRRFRELFETKNRFSLILEENYVDWVLKRPVDVIAQLSTDTGVDKDLIIEGVCDLVPKYKSDNFRSLFHAIQYACLLWMTDQKYYKSLFKNKLSILLDEIFQGFTGQDDDKGSKPSLEVIKEFLSLQSLYPMLARSVKYSPTWLLVARGVFEYASESGDVAFRRALRRREQIRHLQMMSLRHGAPVIDLYCAFLKVRQGRLTMDGDVSLPIKPVADAIISKWQGYDEKQWRASGAWELTELKNNFELIRKLNFPDLDKTANDDSRRLDDISDTKLGASGESLSIRRMLGQALVGQSPAVAATGESDGQRRQRITQQFRMPGMPWVIVATNVFEEGVDLHTYCKTVVHHGISHTASSVEQRTGRVDRIGGLLQRNASQLSGVDQFSDEQKIQSLFPYQNDTFEKHQVRRVLDYCNRFLESLHNGEETSVEDKEMKIDDKQGVPLQITEYLTSPFDVQDSPWTSESIVDALTTPDGKSDFNEQKYIDEIEVFEALLRESFPGISIPDAQGFERHYVYQKSTIRLIPTSQCLGDSLFINISIDEYQKNKETFPTIPAKSPSDGWRSEAYQAVLDFYNDRKNHYICE